MRFLGIVLLSVAAAVVYGVMHDQITARLSIEYFTIGHPKIIESTSPTMLALAWGVAATWWVGLPLGLMLGLCCRAGRRPVLEPGAMLKPLGGLLLLMGVVAVAAGIVGRVLATRGDIRLEGELAADVPIEQHINFLTAWWTHSASYAAGIVGGIGLCLWAVAARRRQVARFAA